MNEIERMLGVLLTFLGEQAWTTRLARPLLHNYAPHSSKPQAKIAAQYFILRAAHTSQKRFILMDGKRYPYYEFPLIYSRKKLGKAGKTVKK